MAEEQQKEPSTAPSFLDKDKSRKPADKDKDRKPTDFRGIAIKLRLFQFLLLAVGILGLAISAGSEIQVVHSSASPLGIGLMIFGFVGAAASEFMAMRVEKWAEHTQT
jgi:hypothetical protein